MPVSVVPGATTLTRTPVPATSSAADFVSPSTACLLATYTDAPAAPTLPYVDETLTMLPPRCGSITLSSCFMLRQHTQHVAVERGGIALRRLFCDESAQSFRPGVVDRNIQP